VVSDAAPCSPTADASLKSKEREKDRQIYGKGESILGEAEYHIRRPMTGLDRLFGMGAASHRANPVPTAT